MQRATLETCDLWNIWSEWQHFYNLDNFLQFVPFFLQFRFFSWKISTTFYTYIAIAILQACKMSRGSSLIIVGRTPRSLTLDWKWPSLASKPWLLLCLFTIGSGSKWTAVEVLWAELSHRIANELVRFPDSPQSSQSGNQLGLKLSADYIRMLAEKSDYVSFPLLHLSSFATKYEYIWTQYSLSNLLLHWHWWEKAAHLCTHSSNTKSTHHLEDGQHCIWFFLTLLNHRSAFSPNAVA